jgi:hypothetical protein
MQLIEKEKDKLFTGIPVGYHGLFHISQGA